MAMDFISPFIEPIMKPLMNHIKYLLKARTNVDNMAEQLEKLKALRLDLHKIIEDAERERKQSIEEVKSWLKSVDEVENKVVKIRNDYLNRRCRIFGDFSINCCLVYKCGRSASKVYEKMVQLKTERDALHSIITMQPPGRGRALPMESTLVGLDLYVERIRTHLTDEAVRIIGIHGMGGVGKTTLLKKVHNALLKGDGLGTEHIIWVVVSKEFQLEKIQAEVAKSLGLTLNEKDGASEHALIIFSYLEGRSFLLLLDDVWQRIKLVDVGIPDPCSGTSSNNRTKIIQKVILTTRQKKVCGSMGADEIVKVEPLEPEDAEALFKMTLGERNLQSNLAIHDLVEKVIRECEGLPLALTVIARAMASKTTFPEWHEAVVYLQRSQANEILDDDDLDMLRILKFSYDSLKKDDLRRCFLYCSLWPEDYAIWTQELISFCIATEVIKEYDSMTEAYDKGHCLIEDLKGACLLEDASPQSFPYTPSVKMHDVLRDMALWIASDCGKNQNKWVVKSGIGLREAPLEAEKWKEAQIVSLMGNEIRELPSVTFECPTLSILLLRSNRYSLKKIHPRFFQNMCALTYLDLSRTAISELPKSIARLATLRCLNLERTYKLKHIPSGMISSLKELQILKLFMSSICKYLDGVGVAKEKNNDGEEFKDDSEEDGDEFKEVSGNGSKCRDMSRREKSLLEELECLPRGLKALTIVVYSADALRRLTTLSRASIWKLGLERLEESSILLEHKILNSLQELWVVSCDNVEVLELVGESCPIEFLWIYSLPNLKKILWRGVAPSVMILHRLRHVHISGCHSLKSISLILRLPSLVALYVRDCKGLECLVEGKDENTTSVAFPSLKHLDLADLPNLSRICGPQHDLPSLQSLEVCDCPMLRKFPFLSNKNSIDKLRRFKCDNSWWDGLEWDDESIKTSLENIRT